MSTSTVSDVSLGDVQETLLIPLYMRALETKLPKGVFRDPKSVDIVEKINYDFEKFGYAWQTRMDVVVRTEIFDEITLKWIERYPSGLIVNLGAGLDGRFERLDNGTIRWVDLDMPDSIELRQRFYAESDRNRFIAKSMFDTTWIDDLASELSRKPDEPVLLLAEGLLFYFDQNLVEEMFRTIADRMPGSEIAFQSISPRYAGKESRVQSVKETKAKFVWGIRHGREVANWDERYEFIDEWYLIDRHRARWRWLRFVTWLPRVRRFVRQVMKITQIRFNASDV